MWLRSVLDKTEYKTDDGYKQAILKGLAEGALEGLVVLGVLELAYIVVDTIKKK